MRIDWDFVKDTIVAAIAVAIGFVVFIVLVTIIIVGGCALFGTPELHNTWGDSIEFRQLMSGGERFSEHETNIGGVTIVVDHETGNQYLCTPEGVTGLTDVDGTPLRVWEATDDGED